MMSSSNGGDEEDIIQIVGETADYDKMVACIATYCSIVGRAMK